MHARTDRTLVQEHDLIDHEKSFKNCGTKKERLRMRNPKLKSKQSNHIRDFQDYVNTLPYLVIFHNDDKHIHDVAIRS